MIRDRLFIEIQRQVKIQVSGLTVPPAIRPGAIRAREEKVREQLLAVHEVTILYAQ